MCNLVFIIFYLQDCIILFFIYIFVYILNSCNKVVQFYIYIYFVFANKKRIIQNYLLIVYLYITITNIFNKNMFIVILIIQKIIICINFYFFLKIFKKIFVIYFVKVAFLITYIKYIKI